MLDGEAVAKEMYAPGSYSRLTDDHVKQMLRRGLKSKTIEAAGLWSALPHQAEELLGFNPHAGGIVIPFFHPFTGEVPLSRVRPDRPPLIGGKPAKYLSQKGAQNRLYFPPDCAPLLRDPTVPLIVTEGEFKVLLAYQYGLFAVGLIGVYGFRGKNKRGETGPISDLDLIVWENRVVTIVHDSDVATNERVRAARDALARELYRRGARIVYSIDLPPDLSGEKVGLDDFLKAQGVDAFLDLDAEEMPSPYPRVKLWTGVELRETRMERPPAIVKGWGIRRRGKGILIGMGGRGKSTLLLQIVCNLAAGTPLLGYRSLDVAGPQRVVVYMAEDPLSEVKFRWEQQMKVLGYDNEVAHRIAFLDSQGAKLMLTDEHGRTALFDALRRHRTDVCILDPLVSLHDAEENSNSAMRGVLDLLTPYQEETGCTFILAHHEPKAPDSNSTAPRGASAIRDWCRTMLRLTPQKAGSNGAQRFQLDLDKANYGGTVWSLTLERAQDSYLFTPLDLEATVTPKDVWELVGPEGQWLEDLKNTIVKRFGVSEVTARRAIKNAEEKKLAIMKKPKNPKTGREKTYVIRGSGECKGGET